MDLTGGLNERIDLIDQQDKSTDELFKLLLTKFKRSALMGCSIPEDFDKKVHLNGLIAGLVYCISAVRGVVLKDQRQAKLVRLRSPWGAIAWHGAWCSGSSQWSLLGDAQRSDMLQPAYVGEAWLSIEDFRELFSVVEVCHLQSCDDTMVNRPAGFWNVRTEFGSWQANQNAGGCRNFS